MPLGPLPPTGLPLPASLPSIPRHLQDGPTPQAGLLGAGMYLGVATEGRQLK